MNQIWYNPSHPDYNTVTEDSLLVNLTANVLKLKLLIYQVEILKSLFRRPRVAVRASRQLGKSVAIAYSALSWALHKPNQLVLVISTGERAAKEVLTKRQFSVKNCLLDSTSYVHDYQTINVNQADLIFSEAGRLQLRPELVKVMEKDLHQDSSLWLPTRYPGSNKNIIVSENATEIELANNSRIICVPCNPDTVRGYSADLVLGDEVAIMRDFEEVAASVFPMTSRTGGHIGLFSTLKGRLNHFTKLTDNDRLTEENPKGWEVLTYPITYNPPPDLDQLRHDLPESRFQEEYMCIPSDLDYQLFSDTLLSQAEF